MSLDPMVRSTVEAYLAAAAVLIDGLYLHGSIALDDFRPGRSDIDFVAVTAERLDADALATLTARHATLPGPPFEGLYLTRAELAAGPLAIGPTPYAREGRFHPSGDFEQNPITWHTLAQRGVRCHGPKPDELTIWADPVVLAAQTRQNLETYWRAQVLEPGSRAVVEPFPGGIGWTVLGVPRLHHTLATGQITSKTGAGEYALRTFDERWHPLVQACLTQRRGGEAPSSKRWPETMEFLAMVIDSAGRLR